MSTTIGLAPAALDLLTIAIRDRLRAASEIAGYRKAVHRVAMIGNGTVLVPGEILVSAYGFGSEIEASGSRWFGRVALMLPFSQDNSKLADDQASAASLVETVIAMVEGWKAISIASPYVGWNFDSSEAVIIESPAVEGEDRARGLSMIGFLVILVYWRHARCSN